MKSMKKRLLVTLAAATLAGSGAVAAALPASALTGTLFTEVGVGFDEEAALINGENAAKASAAAEGFTQCDPFEEVIWQSGKRWYAQFTLLCQEKAA
jgi:hypothetical protein